MFSGQASCAWLLPRSLYESEYTYVKRALFNILSLLHILLLSYALHINAHSVFMGAVNKKISPQQGTEYEEHC